MEQERLRAAARRVMQGDIDAFEPVVHAWHLAVRSVLLTRGVPSADVDDLEQEVFLHAFRGIHLFDAERPFWPWLRTITLNVSRRHLRSREQATTLTHSLEAEVMRHRAGERRGSDAAIEMMKECMKRLGEKARRLLASHYSQEKTSHAIARAEGMSSSGVRNVLCRARQLLRDCVERRMAATEDAV